MLLMSHQRKCSELSNVVCLRESSARSRSSPRGIAGIAARAISVPVMLAGLSNIAAAASELALGKSVRRVGQRRCRHSHAAAQRGDDTDRESFHETGRVSSDVHGSLLELETSPLLCVSRLD